MPLIPSIRKGDHSLQNELRGHKEQWLRICESRPDIFVDAAREVDVGPLQGLLDELDYNLVISSKIDFSTIGFQVRDTQMDRAIREGVIQILNDKLRSSIATAYGAVSRANELTRAWLSRDDQSGVLPARTIEAVNNAIPLIRHARDTLLHFVRSEPD